MEEKRVNLDGIMYNEDGTFKPLTASHGNISGELAHLRNTYMEAERDYFEHLLAIESIRNQFLELVDEHADNLFDRAIKIQEQLEYGNLETNEEKTAMQSMSKEAREAYHMEKLARAEGLMCLLFAAARDKALILELVRTPGGRSR